MERLQKYIAEAGYTSRRKAEELIKSGKVEVDGVIVTELGTKVSGKETITVEGNLLKKEEKEYYILNKPRGVITAVSDDKNRKTVVDIIKSDKRIYPIGRLDYDTTGVLLLTNDGEFSNILMHPNERIEKVYVAKINGIIKGEEINKLKNRDYDYILSIRGEYTPISTLQLLRKVFPHSKLVLYMWDGLHKQNTKGIEKKWPYYDRVFTFDRYDYEENKEEIDFLPLYYYDKYLPTNIKSANNEDLRYAVSFIGTAHDDRIKIVKNVMNQCKKDGLACFSYFYMPHKLIYLKNKLFNPNFKNVHEDDVSYEMLPFEKLYQIYADSKCIVDVENKGQHGLTMRSIEILGLKRKFITTNKDIVNYDFYNPNNVLVIDRDNPIVDRKFFDTPYFELDEEIYQKYSIKNWVLEVLS